MLQKKQFTKEVEEGAKNARKFWMYKLYQK